MGIAAHRDQDRPGGRGFGPQRAGHVEPRHARKTQIAHHRVRVRVNKALEEVGRELKIKSPKTKSSERTVKLSAATVGALDDHRKAMLAEAHCTPDTPVFCGSRRGQWLRKSDVFRHSFAPILKRAGLKFRFHDLRHASATLLLSDGVDVKTVQARLGHSAAAITLDIYGHALDRGQQTAAEKMQELFTSKPKEKKPANDGKEASAG